MKRMKMVSTVFLAIILLVSSSPIESMAETTPTYDTVIKGGDVYNPSTEHILEGYHIGIIDSKIQKITKEEIDGETVIDATGMVVSPGFIDLISYDPNHVGIELKVLDGVTSNLAMHGGTEDAATWYANWDAFGVLTNFGASSFVTRQRWPIVGHGIDEEVTDEEDLQRLVDDVRKNVEAGALGISFSMEYVPGVKHELEPLLELAHEYDLPTFYHLRYSDEERGLDGIQEVIDLGKATGATIHIMHINSTGGTFKMEEALNMVRQAKEDGLDITTDFYPYDFWATYLGSARFRPGWQEAFKITYEDLQIAGTDTRITEETFDQYRAENTLVAALGSMPESELEMLLKDPDTMVGSDTIIEPHHNNHPRGAGAFSRLFGKYVREEQVLTMMDAIKKASYFPAKRMESSAPSMKFKGRIEVGADADITIFNPDTIIDQSSVEDPAAPSEGIEYVIINGVVTKDQDGIVDGVAAGKPIRSYFVDDVTEESPVDFTMTLAEEEIELQSVYEREGKIYLSIEETFEQVGLSVEDSLNGTVEIGEFLSLEIGSKEAMVNDEAIQLSEEPMIYQQQTFILLDDLEGMLIDYYDVEAMDGSLTIVQTAELEPEAEEGNEAAGENGNQQSEKEETESNAVIMIIVSIGLLLILVFLIMKLVKKRRS